MGSLIISLQTSSPNSYSFDIMHILSLLDNLENVHRSFCLNESHVQILIIHIECNGMVFHNELIEQQLVDHLKRKESFLLDPYQVPWEQDLKWQSIKKHLYADLLKQGDNQKELLNSLVKWI